MFFNGSVIHGSYPNSERTTGFAAPSSATMFRRPAPSCRTGTPNRRHSMARSSAFRRRPEADPAALLGRRYSHGTALDRVRGPFPAIRIAGTSSLNSCNIDDDPACLTDLKTCTMKRRVARNGAMCLFLQ